jgi:ribose transport system ATP-binding protein
LGNHSLNDANAVAAHDVGRHADADVVPAALSLRNAAKTFGQVTVLHGVDLAIRRGEIHALVGENGSGKSTLVKILAGFHAPDPGAQLFVAGRELEFPISTDAVYHAQVSFVHQELALLPEATVLENLLITGYRAADYWRIDWSRERDKARRLLDSFGLTDVPVGLQIAKLSASDRAMVAIARAAGAASGADGGGAERSGVLVVDEATAYLAADGAQRVLDAIAAARDQGVGVLMITHKLDEVFALSDEVTVLRDGVVVRNDRTHELTRADVVNAMLGDRGQSATFAESGQRSLPQQEVALGIEGLSVREVRDLSVDVQVGEIVGITGLRGSGVERVPYALVGAVRAQGRVSLGGGRQLELRRLNPRQAVDSGLALVPGDREKDGGADGITMWENMALPSMIRESRKRHWLLRPAKERERVAEMMQQLDVRPLRADLTYERFSGGNRRKALLGKWLLAKPKVLLLDEPTEGVDIGAKKAILDLLQQLAASGMSVLIASTEYEDLARICHRVFVVRSDKPVAELAGDRLDSYTIREACYAS